MRILAESGGGDRVLAESGDAILLESAKLITLSASSAESASVVRSASAVRSVSGPLAVALVRDATRRTAVASVQVAALTVTRLYLLTLSAGEGSSAALPRALSRVLSGSSAEAAARALTAGQTRAAAAPSSGSVARAAVRERSASSAIASALSRAVASVRAAAGGGSASARRDVTRSLSAPAGEVAMSGRSDTRTIAATAGSSSALSRALSRALGAAGGEGASVSRGLAAARTAVAPAAGAVRRDPARTWSASAGSSASQQGDVHGGVIERTLEAATVLLASVALRIERAVTGVSAEGAALRRATSQERRASAPSGGILGRGLQLTRAGVSALTGFFSRFIAGDPVARLPSDPRVLEDREGTAPDDSRGQVEFGRRGTVRR